MRLFELHESAQQEKSDWAMKCVTQVRWKRVLSSATPVYLRSMSGEVYRRSLSCSSLSTSFLSPRGYCMYSVVERLLTSGKYLISEWLHTIHLKYYRRHSKLRRAWMLQFEDDWRDMLKGWDVPLWPTLCVLPVHICPWVWEALSRVPV